MTKLHLFRIKNSMLAANLISNAIGVGVVFFLSYSSATSPSAEMEELSRPANMIFLPLSFIVPFLLALRYERPIRSYWDNQFRGPGVSEEEMLRARRKLLNEPFFLIALDFGVWLTAALFYTTFFWWLGAQTGLLRSVFFRSIITGLITITVAFFVLEFVLQRRIVPHMFPNGGLYLTPGTLRIRIRTRLVGFLFACNLVPFLAMLQEVGKGGLSVAPPERVLEQLQTSVPTMALIFMAVGIWLTFLVSSNLTRPLGEIILILRDVRNGLFERRVRVTSNDEIGYTGDVINEMTDGLKERDFIKETFGKYITQEIRDEILSGRIPLDGEVRRVTVLFADLRNYTPMVERTDPKEVVRILNGYFKEMEEAIREHHGLVLQYIGDEIEAVFGAPIFREDHPALAVQAALEMERRLRAFNQDLERRAFPPLSHGIGIHTGEVVAANIGSPDRLSYTLVGDTVNLSSRLQDLNKELGTKILMSEATRSCLGEMFTLRELPATRVKGKTQDIRIYTLE